MEIRCFKTINGNLRSRFHEIKVVKLMFQPDRERKFSATNIPKTVRFTEWMGRELVELHRETGIPVNELILQCCRYALDHLEDNREEP